ncbi:MAG: hypothetical protein IPH81_05085 [Candidatus Microthrix sp.]|jgi:threonine/homoserine/homoserine lactone efflux protein|nr:hypothetical protein [Candidatus Microthrix sp.]MBP7595119.1 hypothetical protein [Candidatus Microthrix sp.]MBP9065091.1 hypothetical protein [Candidatus Microthrix sp.]
MNGLIVGFTSSLPLLLIVGPVSLMVLDTGLTTGVRGGWPAPLGVAGVDLAYASATAAAGLGLQRLLNEHQQALGWGGGLALMVLAAYLLIHARSQRGGADSVGPTDSAPAPMAVQVPVPVPVPVPVGSSGPLPTPSASAAGRADAPRPAPVGLAARFAALCAINPLTLVAFATLAMSAGAALGPGWVLGIVSASVLVHGGFLVLGDALGRVLTPQLIHRGRMLGCLGVAVLGIHTLLGVAV